MSRFEHPSPSSLPPRGCSVFGDPSRVPLLFVHGIRLSRAIWEEHARLLSDEFYVVTTDLPGHASLRDRRFTTGEIAAQLDAAIKFIGSPPIVIGYSLGGYIAMTYARKHPERTRGLVLADCTNDLRGWHAWPYGAFIAVTKVLPESFYRHVVRAVLRVSLPQEMYRVVEPLAFDREVLYLAPQLGTLDAPSRLLQAYEKPVLFVNGEFDVMFRLDEQRFLERVPRSRLALMRRVDHVAPLRRPREFCDLIRRFAQDSTPG